MAAVLSLPTVGFFFERFGIRSAIPPSRIPGQNVYLSPAALINGAARRSAIMLFASSMAPDLTISMAS